MFYMNSPSPADFGIGNITGTRYFLGDMSKEGKDALIKLNKARVKHTLSNAAAQQAYGHIDNLPEGFIGSTSKHAPEKRISAVNARTGISSNRQLIGHENRHAVPIALNRPGLGLAPTNRGEGLVSVLESASQKGAFAPYEKVMGPNPAHSPFKNEVIKYPVPNVDELPQPAPFYGRTLNKDIKDTINNNRYMSSIIQDINDHPGMVEALEASDYLGSRAKEMFVLDVRRKWSPNKAHNKEIKQLRATMSNPNARRGVQPS